MRRKRKIKEMDMRETAPKRNKKKKRHSSRLLLYIFLGFVAVVVFVVLSLTVLFPVKTVSVVGKSPYETQQIIDISGVQTGQNLIMTNGKQIASLLTKNLPYISSAEVKKKFPSTIQITVKKAKVAGQIEQGENYHLFDKDYKYLETKQKRKKNVPIIRGVKLKKTADNTVAFKSDKNNEKLLILKDTYSAIELHNINNITVIQLMSVNDVNITYADKVVLQCGSGSNLDTKMDYAKLILEKQASSNQTGILNLSRIPNDKQQAYFTACELTNDQISVPKEQNQEDLAE